MDDSETIDLIVNQEINEPIYYYLDTIRFESIWFSEKRLLQTTKTIRLLTCSRRVDDDRRNMRN